MLGLLLTFSLISHVATVPVHTRVASSVSADRPASYTQTPEIPKGQIIDKVACTADPDQSYALYLPSNYSPDRKWPVLYAFDPGARGKVPVERFREAAEKYGWIVAGSNNSRNGALAPSVNAWNAILNDTHSRFAIDDERAYVTGLSGGARLALYFASRCHDCVAGVIACGAGFPGGLTPSPAMHFAFFGAVGVDDFNFPELKDLDGTLAKVGIRHRIEVFDGRHEWAPSSVATDAVAWMELQAMKAGQRQRDDGLVDLIWQKGLQQAKDWEQAKKTYDAYLIYVGLADSFKGLRDVTEIETRVSQLRDGREVKDAIRGEQQQIRKQTEIEGQLRALMAVREPNSSAPEAGGVEDRSSDEGFDREHRLQSTLAELRKQSKGAADSGERRIARRVLEGVFIGLSEQGRELLQTQKRYDQAVRTLKLATEVNPDRAGTFFYLAWAQAANGDKKKSLQALQTAVEKGFSDLSAIADNRAFDGIRDDVQYRQIITALQRKH